MFKQVLEKIKKIDFCYVLIILFTLIVSLMYADKIMFPQSDVGRELYFPMEVLNGKVLYKDIFNLFGPLSYLFTALIFKIFGVSVSTFYCIGNVFAILMVTGVYMLSRRFMSKIFASVICLFIIITGIVTKTNFSYVTPYASAMLYGAVAFVYSLYFYVRGIETDKIKYFYISSFLAGIAVANKYEFVFYAAFLAILFFWRYKENILKIIKLISLLVLPCLAGYLFLFAQGLTLRELINHFSSLLILMGTEGYHVLYKEAGSIPSKITLIEGIEGLLTIIFVVFFAYLGMRVFNKQKLLGVIIIAVTYSVLIAKYAILIVAPSHALLSLPMVVSIVFIFLFNKTDGKEKFVCAASLLASFKVFFGMSLTVYGVYYAPFIIIAMYVLFKSEKLRTAFSLILLILTFFMFKISYERFDSSKMTPVGTKRNCIYTPKGRAYTINSAISYIKTNSKPTDKVIIYPEGSLINALTGRPSDDYYYALSPAYLEAWGEDNLIKYFSDKKNQPEYFIFANEIMSSYGKDFICTDYGREFCRFVGENYTLDKIIVDPSEKTDVYVIYKR